MEFMICPTHVDEKKIDALCNGEETEGEAEMEDVKDGETEDVKDGEETEKEDEEEEGEANERENADELSVHLDCSWLMFKLFMFKLFNVKQ